MPEAYVILCLEMSVDDLAILYSIAQRKGKDVKAYIRDLVREDVSRTLQSQQQQ